MTLGPTLPPKGGVDELHQDPSDLGRKKNEGHEVPNIFNNQMRPIGQFHLFMLILFLPWLIWLKCILTSFKEVV